ncbi:MAG: sigma-54 dependent transcriptional regulator [Candidatus Kapabacteria bacterium]|nr:sigma-54 dependent transcriptional regulator [Candidatus Kapabacteria bacterium]
MSKHVKTDSLDATKPTILVVDDDEFARENVEISLQSAGANVLTAGSAYQALKVVESTYCHIIVTDLKMPGMDGVTFAEKVRERHATTKFVLVTGYADEEAVIRALRVGVNEFLKKPYRNAELLIAIQKLLEQHNLEEENRLLRERIERENIQLKRELELVSDQSSSSSMIGASPALKACTDLAVKVARFGINALIQGENGTGKEVMAQYIHQSGARAAAPFVAVNCAAISATLFESEMFGYEKGAFTGANESRAGLFELANGGILFLDEVTEVPTTMQAKLLRALETQTIRRVGGNRDIAIDVQVLSATNRTITDAIDNGFLRTDLYHRLATVEVNLPPLRERVADIPLLAESFRTKFERQFGVQSEPVSELVLRRFAQAPWPGNIRQLGNVMKRWVLFGPDVALRDIDGDVDMTSRVTSSVPCLMHYDFVQGTMDEVELAKQHLVTTIMQRYNGNKTQAAKHLGLSYPGLLKILRRIEERSDTSLSSSAA